MSEDCPRGDLEFGTIPGMVERCAATYGDALAVVDGDVRLSFSEFAARVEQAAKAYIAAGVQKGDRIAIWAPNMWEWMVVAVGAHAAVPHVRSRASTVNAYSVPSASPVTSCARAVMGSVTSGASVPAVTLRTRTTYALSLAPDENVAASHVSVTRSPTV